MRKFLSTIIVIMLIFIIPVCAYATMAGGIDSGNKQKSSGGKTGVTV